jgi:RimJ/RimL family protein N-acetyltransferase
VVVRARPELRTARLALRGFTADDLEALVAMHADARVMEHLPGVLTRAECEALLARLAAWDGSGLGSWAVDASADGGAACVGFVLLKVPGFAAPFQPCVEVGWRLAAAAWGRGYATEAARALLAHGFDALDLAEIVSFTVPANVRSRAVMERLGFRHDAAGDFEHPALPPGHRLRAHVLYRLARRDFQP